MELLLPYVEGAVLSFYRLLFYDVAISSLSSSLLLGFGGESGHEGQTFLKAFGV